MQNTYYKAEVDGVGEFEYTVSTVDEVYDELQEVFDQHCIDTGVYLEVSMYDPNTEAEITEVTPTGKVIMHNITLVYNKQCDVFCELTQQYHARD